MPEFINRQTPQLVTEEHDYSDEWYGRCYPCPSCGSDIMEDFDFCPICGVKLDWTKFKER